MLISFVDHEALNELCDFHNKGNFVLKTGFKPWF